MHLRHDHASCNLLCCIVGQERVSVVVTCCQMVPVWTWGLLLDRLWLLVMVCWWYDTRVAISAVFVQHKSYTAAPLLCFTAPYSRCTWAQQWSVISLTNRVTCDYCLVQVTVPLQHFSCHCHYVWYRPTQPPTLSGMGNEYQPKCGEALWLGVKAGMVHSTCG